MWWERGGRRSAGARAAGSGGVAPDGRALRDRLAEWTRRYLPLELMGTLTALVGGLLVAAFTSSPLAVAYAGTWGENIGYYGLAAAREMRARRVGAGARPAFLGRLAGVVRSLLWEFGAAELIDSFLTRPFCMLAAGAILGSVGAGIVVGKVVADVLFYAIAIAFYEIGKRAR